MSPIDRAADLLRSARHLVILTGAGVSAESGLPTFRGTDGLWKGRDPTTLATPEAFARDPQLVWEFYNYRRHLVRNAEPNPAHRAIAELPHHIPRVNLITQNVDRLHHRAGSTDVLELHGNLHEVRCTGCDTITDRATEPLPDLPRCDTCHQILRPNVVWFGEPLPPGAWERARELMLEADTLLVVGTSAVVHPAASLAPLAKSAGAQVIEINLERTSLADFVDVGLYAKAGEIFPRLLDAIAS